MFWLLKIHAIRRRLAFKLKNDHFEALDIAAPLGKDLLCPIFFKEAWCSFSEIFIENEYEAFMKLIPLPERWLDLGCHAGYFSLYILLLRRRLGLVGAVEALLVDGDSRVSDSVAKLIEINNLKSEFTFWNGIISNESGLQEFVERPFMYSSAGKMNLAEKGRIRTVMRVSDDDLRNFQSGPLDLIKVDIEGGEYEFLLAYKHVLAKAKHLILEWHPWHTGGGGKAQIIELAERAGFDLLFQSNSPNSQEKGGLLLFHRSKSN